MSYDDRKILKGKLIYAKYRPVPFDNPDGTKTEFGLRYKLENGEEVWGDSIPIIGVGSPDKFKGSMLSLSAFLSQLQSAETDLYLSCKTTDNGKTFARIAGYTEVKKHLESAPSAASPAVANVTNAFDATEVV